MDTDFLIGVAIDQEHQDTSWMDPDELERVASGELVPYGVGLVRVTDAFKFEPDWGTFVWAAWADAGLDGTYPDAKSIPNDYLSLIAMQQVEEFGK